MSSTYGICFEWKKTGRCKFGARCKFRHVGAAALPSASGRARAAPPRRMQQLCHEWQRTGTCRFGNSCKFKHLNGGSIVANNNNSGGSKGTPKLRSSGNDLTKFLQHLAHVHKSQFGKELEQSMARWHRCWQEYPKLDPRGLTLLIESLAKTPESSEVEAPPLDIVEAAVLKYLKSSQKDDAEAILTKGKTVRSAVERLLHFEWDYPKDVVQQGLSNIALTAEDIMIKKHKEHRVVANDLMGLVEKTERSWNIKLKEKVSICPEIGGGEVMAEPTSFADWKTANIKWLCNPFYFAPTCCPKMKVGKEGVYENSEEYLDTIHQLWVAMTFSDGHAAFAPHCRARGANGTTCGSALSPIAESEKFDNLRCRTPSCRRIVEFKCRIRNHDTLCTDCAMRSIANHMKGPDARMKASTHVYDCRVDQVKDDGTLYLKDFKSRNPPPNVHWGTTKRLSPPNLVGVVKLHAKGVALTDTDMIKWGECVYHGNSRGEAQRRQSGDLAVNISSIVDCDPEYFQEGSYVAVIDCMTFVPEWVPVLKAIESQRDIELPFDGGKYLNLVMHDPVGHASGTSMEDLATVRNSQIIEEMVNLSELEPIREIRRHPDKHELLITRLDQLVQSATLDKGQLISFTEALQYPVHLTQGPPGTGKSYLGVVLVRALLVIREIWLQVAKDVSPQPILVLSYKNHAIDEFLVDLVRAEPMKLRNQLIRIGGQCKDARLAMYSERSSFQADQTVRQKHSCLEDLNHLRASIRVTLDDDLASFLAYREKYEVEDDPKLRNRLLIEASEKIMEMIARRSMLQEALLELEKEGTHTTPAKAIDKFRFLEVHEVGNKRNASTSVSRFCQKLQSEEVVPLLSEALEHYRDRKHFGDILVMFLCGKVPLPPCRYRDRSLGKFCTRPSFEPSVDLCDDHRCQRESGLKKQGSPQSRCPKSCSSENSEYCQEHECNVEQCTGEKFDAHPFCHDHCCRLCLEVKSSECLQARGAPPGNVCHLHPLCLSQGCLAVCLEGATVCKDHFEPMCLALNKKKKPCKAPPISRLLPYCDAHKHMAIVDFDSDSEEEDGDEVQILDSRRSCRERQICAFIVKGYAHNGKRCNETALPGKEFCYDHDMSSVDKVNVVVHAASSVSEVETVNAERAGRLVAVESNPTPSDDRIRNVRSTHDEESEGSDFHSVLSVESQKSQSSNGTSNSVAVSTKPVDFDELDCEVEDEGQHLQHLQEVYEVVAADDDLSDSFNDDGSLNDLNDETKIDDTDETLILDSKDWTWSMSPDERWGSCQRLLADLRVQILQASAIIKSCVLMARKEHQTAVVRAKARMYQNKTIIGGTMVGCISRLPSIRATRPFAVIVEEASEVLEPLLFSCLSESTAKLEMIGDHRQLQPSVMSRYEFELNNKINVSLFQRLIEAPDGHEIPSTVLAVQRRMRTNICDLTREYYSDVVEIADEGRCSTQLIGSRNLTPTTIVSSTGGREIPGVGPHVFLWTHPGDQKRASVGISRMNPVEAIMACSLAEYLVSCGVPKSSIAILTPYKGQLMEMRKQLLQSRSKLISRDPTDTDVCRISTVDRFQGDEEDIVICSLVVDENSKTNFVKLVNRMIVLLSRARLGLYILANINYFEKITNVPIHWRRTLEMLEKPGSNDSSIESLDDNEIFTGLRSGNELPLCCPIHRFATLSASSASQLKLGFCTEICKEVLSCGHACSLPCHWPAKTHSRKCEIEVQSPCVDHPKKLTCSQLYKDSKGYPSHASHEEVRLFHRCTEMVKLDLRCKHIVKKPCWMTKEIQSGKMSPPICVKKSPTPFRFPSCDHVLEVSCDLLDKYTKDPTSVKCTVTQLFEPTCGHNRDVACWKHQEYTTDAKLFTCKETMTTSLPWCGHTHQMPCATAVGLATWDGVRCEEVGKVVEGIGYGPVNFPCKEQVTFVRKCGHDMQLACKVAMAKSLQGQPCRAKKSMRNPDCGHECMISCSTSKAFEGLSVVNPRDEVVEGQVPPPTSIAGSFPRCTKSVRLNRKCGHIAELECSEIRKPLHKCEVEVHVKSPLCGHTVSVGCSSKHFLEEIVLWDDVTRGSIESGGVIPAGSELSQGTECFKNESLSLLNVCEQNLSLELTCGHRLQVKCNEILLLISSEATLSSSCDQSTSVRLPCGHDINCLCRDAQLVAAGKRHSLKCHTLKRINCWNFEKCGSSVNVECHVSRPVSCQKLTTWVCPERTHTFKMRLCSNGNPSHCPNCVTERLQSLVLSYKSNELLRTRVRDLLVNSPPMDVSFSDIDDDGLSRTKARFEKWVKDQENVGVWERESPGVERILCFRVLKEENKGATSFDPKVFVNARTMNGILAKTFSKSNIVKLTSKPKDRFKLLVGSAVVLKTQDHRHKQLSKKKKQKANLVLGLWSQNYDSILYIDQEGFENLVVWDPFPIETLAIASLTTDELMSVAEKLESEPSIVATKPRPMLFVSPDGIVACDAEGCTEREDDEDSVGSGNSDIDTENETESLLAGTCLQGFRVDLKWAGGIHERMNRAVEKSLLDKMQFVRKDAKPFQAIKVIENMKISADFPEQICHLLLAAECVQHSPDRAETEMNKYLKLGRQTGKDFLLHPWSLIVNARIHSEDAQRLLSVFSEQFPLNTDVLTGDEVLMLDDTTSNNPETTKSWPEKLWEQWSQLKESNGIVSTAMDELLHLTGLRKIKEEAVRLWMSAIQLQKMDETTRNENPIIANYCFLGNPGTGKTTVARLFASVLRDSGIRSDDIFVETSAQEVKDAGTDDFREKISNATNGVLFIDEAYDLDPVSDHKGKPIVNELLSVCENRRGDISFVLAGYEDDFEKKFFAYNPGLRSRFKCVTFDDFDEVELSTIWTEMRRKKKWEEEDGVCKVVVNRLLKLSGKKGFGNAREVRVRLEKATQDAMVRMGDNFEQESMELRIADVIGEDPRLANEKLERVRSLIDEKIGWDRVKRQVQELLKICSVNYGRELQGLPLLDVFLNRMFLGNPGTGKTTCAKLYGRLLKELGLLSNGDVVLKTASDFKGSVIGESEKTTNTILDASKGKVLIIDEAYALDDGWDGKQVLDTLVEKIQGQPSDDRAVILVGYEEPMLEMIRTQNPGLSRRFPKDQAFYFDDYNEAQLLDILNLNFKKNGVEASLEFRQKALEVLEVQKLQANFGNAGSVETLLKSAMVRAAERCPSAETLSLEKDDIVDPGLERAEKNQDPLSSLDNLYRMEKVKSKIEQMSKSWEVSKREGDDSPNLGHFVFTGSPGTGKTTVARAIANVLFSLNLIPTNKCFETSALDLTADYVGQTSTKVDNALQEAKGGILFIDEAYNLGKGSFGKEACDSIVAGMTSEKFKDVVIIIAGYPFEIDEMLKTNPGLKSRFSHFFEFPDWTPGDCKAFFERLSMKNAFELEDGAGEAVERGCSTLVQRSGWANGRDVTSLWDRAKGHRDVRVYDDSEFKKVLTVADVEKAISDMVTARLPTTGVSKTREEPERFASDSKDNTPPKMEISRSTGSREDGEPDDQCCDEDDCTPDDSDDENSEGSSHNNDMEEQRDPEVPDEIWDALEKSKKERREQAKLIANLNFQLDALRSEEAEAQRKAAEAAEVAARLAQMQTEAEEAERQRLEEEMRELEEKRLRDEQVLLEIENERRKKELELQRLEEAIREAQKIQEQLQRIRPCPMGFSWYRCGSGWACGGGSHFVSDSELRRAFTEYC